MCLDTTNQIWHMFGFHPAVGVTFDLRLEARITSTKFYDPTLQGGKEATYAGPRAWDTNDGYPTGQFDLTGSGKMPEPSTR